ncbi:MAG: EpsG family protein, partial [Bacteroidaceae bacterium]|nr:EpsG family protein [Bacteroidaceae bacterium]
IHVTLRISIFMPLISLFFDKFTEFFQDKIEAYTDVSGGFVISIGYLERLLTGILIICYYDKLKEIRPKNVMFINLSILYFILFFFFSEFEIMSRRLSNLFVVSYWVLWSDMIKCFTFENNKKLFVTFLSLYCIMRVIISTNGPIKEYENILFGAKSYQERLYIYRQNYQEEE